MQSMMQKYRLSRLAEKDLAGIYGRHVIFFFVLEDGSALISRVLHERMDYDRHLE